MTDSFLVRLDGVTARAAHVALGPLRLELAPGAHTVVGTREDGTSLLLDVLAGRARVRSGSLEVLGGAPSGAARGIAHVPREAALPEVMRVSEVLELAAQIRGEARRDPSVRLGALGIAELAGRRAKSLAPDEARAVLACEALTSSARVVLFDEPYAPLDPRAAAHFASAVRRRAAEGACVVVATASLREASELADDQLVLERGTLVHRGNALAQVLAPGARSPRLRAVTAEPRALLSALASEQAVATIEADARSVVASGPDPVAVAEAIARAALQAGVQLESLGVDAPQVEELRASLAADVDAAYRAAKDRAKARSAGAAEGVT
jgi:ABC-2 type transport system ATP-binding protein